MRLRAFLAVAIGLMAAPVFAGDVRPTPGDRAQQPVPLMTNLAPIADWGVQQPFIDRMKTARPWIGHLPNRWGGLEASDLRILGVLDDAGWPKYIPAELASIGTLVMTDLPEAAQSLTGRYVLRFDGRGLVEVSGRASNLRYGENDVSFDFSPGPGGVIIKIQRSDPSNYVRNITVVRQGRISAFDQGAVFNPDFLTALSGFQGLRFMDWMQTNNSGQQVWSDRPRLNDYTYAERGAPLEIISHLANTLRVDPWLTLPHQTDDAFFHQAAKTVHDHLEPNLTAYVEYSNEVWNWSFAQAAWAEEQARSRWNVEYQWQQFYGMRAAQMAQIWRSVFSDAPARLTMVISTQAAWRGLEDQVLNAPLWQAENPANPAPSELFDAYAVTAYFGHRLGNPDSAPMIRDWLETSVSQAKAKADALGLKGKDYEAYLDKYRFDAAFAVAGAELLDGRVSGNTSDTVQGLLTDILPYHRDVAARHELDLIIYEGGTHVTGQALIAEDEELGTFFRAFNYSPEMGLLYSHLLAGWPEIGPGPFALFNDVYHPSKWGSWGNRRYLSDENPRWHAIRQFLKGAG